ncbi:MAG: cytochrome c [Bacteroidota bacterium]|nr:cytochrome c [Bacteroidota bacterium]MDP4229631.1 cytochrome c [Bacteroidota bacterium]MDP4234913.1 cytochrome c [Bacteroidota bacterium]
MARLYTALCIALLCLTSCKQTPFEEESTAKKINTLRRGKVSDAEWSKVYAGKQVYETYCSGCHGVKGDGKGPASAMLSVQPRNFTRAMFKFISTPSGSLPADADLHRTLLRGVPRSSMPSWAMLPETDRANVIEYIKTFSERWQTSPPPNALTFGNPPTWVGSLESAAKGKAVYAKMGCANCHGQTGLGDGNSAAALKDAEDNPIKPFNFREGVLKGGSRIEDIYRTFYTGLAGTPMPAFGGILTDEENWHLVSYVIFLMGKTNVKEADLANIPVVAATDSTKHK